MELLNLTSHDGTPPEAPEEQETDPKTTHWLNVITILNFVAAAGLLVLAMARLTRLMSPGTLSGIEWMVGLPLRPVAMLIFGHADERLLAKIALGCMAGLATVAGLGLQRRLDWARRWTILFYLLCLAYITPTVLLMALLTGKIWLVAPLGLLFIGGPMQIVWHLLQPQVKKATGAPNPTFSRAKFTSMFAFATLGSLLFYLWIAMAMVQAVGRGLR